MKFHSIIYEPLLEKPARTLTVRVDPHGRGSDVSRDGEVRNPQILQQRKPQFHYICNLALKTNRPA